MPDRPYQARTIERIRDAIRKGSRRICVVLPTGAGKGYIAARMMQLAAEKENQNTFLAASRELIFQLGAQLEKLGVPSYTVMSGVDNEYQDAQEHNEAKLCNVIAKDTLIARAFNSSRMQIPPSELIQIDEAHQSISNTYGRIIEHHAGKILIGWTATPCRSDGKSLNKYFDILVQGATYSELREAGFLVPVRVISPRLKPDLIGVKTGKISGDYNQRELARRMDRESMVGDVVKEWRKNNKDGLSTVGFFCSVAHSIHARNEFRKFMGKDQVEHIDGEMVQSHRDDIMGRIRDGKVIITTNYGIAHTGVDVPRWKYLMCARPTKSFLVWRQMGGRIQRPFEGLSEAIIQDHTDNTLTFGYPDEDVAWCLNTKMKAEDLPRTVQKGRATTEPYACKKCGCEYAGKLCPNCGHQPGRIKKGERLEMIDGILYQTKRIKPPAPATPEQKQKYWDYCVGICIHKGFKIKVASGMYKSRFGVWPRNLKNLPKGSEFQMDAKEFYSEVMMPNKRILEELVRTQMEDAFL